MSLGLNRNKIFLSIFATVQKNVHPKWSPSTRNVAKALPIEWKKPARVSFADPSNTGEGVTRLTVDMNKSPVMVEQSEEIITANNLVKRLFSFHFLGRKHAMIRARDEMVQSVQNHKYDTRSLEARIAAKTAIIRNLLEHYENFPRDLRSKTYLNAIIFKRQKDLKNLRRWDYKKFEWLLEKLDLRYKPHLEVFEKVERKKSIRKLTDEYCESYKQRKLQEYKEVLENQKLDFLKHKVASLEWMRNEEIKCGVEPSVTEADINAAKNQLREHERILESKPIQVDSSRNILSDV